MHPETMPLLDLNDLLQGVNEENRHDEIETGLPVGAEEPSVDSEN